MSAQAIQAGEAFVSLKLKVNEFQSGLSEASEQLQKFGGKLKGTMEKFNSAFSGALKSLQPLAPAISAMGISLSGLGTVIGIVADSTATLTTIINALNAAIWANPWTFFAECCLAAIAIIVLLATCLAGIESPASKAAKAAEDLRKQHDEFRESARQSADILDKLNKKTELNTEEITASNNAWNDLKRNAKALGVSLGNLESSYDTATGKINDTTGAMLKLREAMRVQELEELNNEFEKQGVYLDELTAKLHNGKVGWGRWLGTWVSLGRMDNAEEIQRKIDETRKKIRENSKRQGELIDFSEDFREAEKQLEAFQAKDEEATRNATQNKIAAIQKEFAEREAVLKKLIEEADVRKNLSEQDRKQLEERKKALDELNKKQQERIDLLKAEEKARIQKIKDDYDEKKKANEDEKNWKKKLEGNPNTAFADATKSASAAEAQMNKALEDRTKAVDENKSTKEIKALDKALEKARADAEMWNRRKEEAEAKAKDAESKRDKELDDLDSSRKKKEKARDDKKDEQKWKADVEKNAEAALQDATQHLDENKGNLDAAYANLQNLIQTGASEKEKKAARENVEQIEANIDKWQSRVDNLQIGRIPKQTTSPATNPAAMMAGSADAQRKFLENRNAKYNFMDETNAILLQMHKEQHMTNEKLDALEGL